MRKAKKALNEARIKAGVAPIEGELGAGELDAKVREIPAPNAEGVPVRRCPRCRKLPPCTAQTCIDRAAAKRARLLADGA